MIWCIFEVFSCVHIIKPWKRPNKDYFLIFIIEQFRTCLNIFINSDLCWLRLYSCLNRLALKHFSTLEKSSHSRIKYNIKQFFFQTKCLSMYSKLIHWKEARCSVVKLEALQSARGSSDSIPSGGENVWFCFRTSKDWVGVLERLRKTILSSSLNPFRYNWVLKTERKRLLDGNICKLT